MDDPNRPSGEGVGDHAGDRGARPSGAMMGLPAVLVDGDGAARAAPPVAILVVTPLSGVSAFTSDHYPGADPVNLVLARFLRRGFDLVAQWDSMALTTLPHLPELCLTLTGDRSRMLVDERGLPLCTGPIGADIPATWYSARDARGTVAVLVADKVEVETHGSFMASIHQARLTGNLIGATISASYYRKGPGDRHRANDRDDRCHEE